MSTLEFQHRLSKFELEHKCILFADDKGEPLKGHLKLGKAMVHAHDRYYPAEVRDFFLNSKFYDGLLFEGSYDFFFDNHVEKGRNVLVRFNASEVKDDAHVVHITVVNPHLA